MRIAVVGAGGLGCKLGLYLSEAGQDVTLVHRRQDFVECVRKHGLGYLGSEGSRRVRINAVVDPKMVGAVDAILVFVKSYDTAQALPSIEALMGNDTLIVTFQNGLGNRELLARHFGEEHVALAVTFQGATMAEGCTVEDKGRGPTYFAWHAGTETRVSTLSEVFTAAGMESVASRDVDGVVWAKLAVTAAINGLATVLRVTNGALYTTPAARALAHQIIDETISVATALGVTPAFDAKDRFDRVAQATQSMYSGTLLDAVRGKKTEADAIHGEILQRAQRLSVTVPLVETIYRMICSIEQTHEHSIHKMEWA